MEMVLEHSTDNYCKWILFAESDILIVVKPGLKYIAHVQWSELCLDLTTFCILFAFLQQTLGIQSFPTLPRAANPFNLASSKSRD